MYYAAKVSYRLSLRRPMKSLLKALIIAASLALPLVLCAADKTASKAPDSPIYVLT